MLLLAALGAALGSASRLPWESGGGDSLLTIKHELCPAVFRPFRHEPRLFHSRRGEQACCVLDRAIGVVEILHNVRKCRTYQAAAAAVAAAAASAAAAGTREPDHSGAAEPTGGAESAAARAALLLLPAGVVSPCFPGAADALAGSVLACCGDVKGHASSYAACAAALAGGSIKRAVTSLREWYGLCAKEQNTRGSGGGGGAGGGGQQAEAVAAPAAIISMPMSGLPMLPEGADIPLPAYDGMCQQAEGAAVGLLQTLLRVAGGFYRAGGAKDAVPAARAFIAVCDGGGGGGSDGDGGSDGAPRDGGGRGGDDGGDGDGDTDPASAADRVAAEKHAKASERRAKAAAAAAAAAAATSHGDYRLQDSLRLHRRRRPPPLLLLRRLRRLLRLRRRLAPATPAMEAKETKEAKELSYAQFAAEKQAKGSERSAKASAAERARDPFRTATAAPTPPPTPPVCPAGKHAHRHAMRNGGKRRCGDCRAGRHSLAGQRCRDCPEGQYQPSVGQPGCTACARCPFGQHLHHCEGARAGACHRCPLGRYTGGTEELSPDACVPCTACQKGAYDPQCGGETRGQCYKCPAGKYKDGEGSWSATCKKCTSCGTRAAAAAAAARKGKGKGKGAAVLPKKLDRYHVLTWITGCGGATRGRCGVADEIPVDTKCKRCRPGEFADPKGHCEACPWGQFAAGCDAPKCKRCPAGKYQPGARKSQCVACDACPPSEARHLCAGRHPGMCHRCPPGRFVAGEAQAPADGGGSSPFWGKKSSCTACETCPAGRYNHLCGGSQRGACVACAAGKYMVRYTTVSKREGRGCRMCQPCAQGQGVRLRCGGERPGWCSRGPHPAPTPRPTALPTPAPTPRPCGRGAYRASQVAICVVCPRGKYSDELEQKACRPCAAGRYNAHRGGEECTACAACPEGQSYPAADADDDGATTLMARAGAGAGAGGGACGAANAGSCAPTPTPAATQAPTPAPTPACRWGEYLTSWREPTCEPCPNGKFAHYGWNRCRPCPRGRFIDGPGSGACKQCRPCADPWAALQGCGAGSAGTCGPCPAGQHFAHAKVCDGNNRRPCHKVRVCRRCQICPGGEYAWNCQGHSMGKCRACPKGKYNDGGGAAAGADTGGGDDDMGLAAAAGASERLGCKPCRCEDPATLITGCDPTTGPVCISAYVHSTTQAPKPNDGDAPKVDPSSAPSVPTTAAPTPAPTPAGNACLPAILKWAEENLGLPNDWAQ